MAVDGKGDGGWGGVGLVEGSVEQCCHQFSTPNYQNFILPTHQHTRPSRKVEAVTSEVLRRWHSKPLAT